MSCFHRKLLPGIVPLFKVPQLQFSGRSSAVHMSPVKLNEVCK